MPEVGLLVDLLAMVEVAAELGEGAARRRVGQPQEFPLPERHRRGLAAAFGQDLHVVLPQFAVGLQEDLQGRGGLREAVLEFGGHLVQIGVAAARSGRCGRLLGSRWK